MKIKTSEPCAASLPMKKPGTMAGETVTRVLGQLKRDQLIQIRGAALTVLQPQELERMAV